MIVAAAPVLLLLILFSPTGQAETLELDTIHVDTTRISRPLADSPAAISVINEQQIQEGQPRLQLDESLQRVPGIYAQNRHNFAQNLRISSRGFGARAPFGVRGIHIRVDGIPETLPDGQSQLDIIDLESASQINVIRGPSSVLYGNASGGVIDIRSDDGRDQAANGRLRADAGSHGLRKTSISHGGQYQSLNHRLTLSEVNQTGWREQSRVRKRLANWRAGWQLDNHRRMELVATALHTPFAQDPGGLTRDEARDDPRQAAASASALDAGQRVRQNRIGLFYHDNNVAGGEFNARSFYTQRDFRQQLPFPGPSLPTFEREFFGVGADYHGLIHLAGSQHRYLVGVELEQQRDDRQRYTVVGGNIIDLNEDVFQTATAGGVFLQTDTPLSDALTLSLGLRADRLHLRQRDALSDDPDDNSTGNRRFTEYSQSAGLLWQINPHRQGYLNIATAFEAPTFTEFANPDGDGFNPAIEPQQSLSYEIGLRGGSAGGLNYDAALFLIDVRDEILPFEDAQGRTFYENAGRTRRHGLELAMEYPLGDSITLNAAWTLAEYRLQRFRDRDGNDLSGNQLPGLPQQQLFAEVAWRNQQGAFVKLDGLYRGRLYAENENLTRIGDTQMYNLSGGQRHDYRNRPYRYLQVHGGIRNLTGANYFDNIRINANPGDAPEARRYFEPAPGRTLWLGVEAGF